MGNFISIISFFLIATQPDCVPLCIRDRVLCLPFIHLPFIQEGFKSTTATKKCMIGGFILGEFLGPHIGQHGEDDQKIDDDQRVVGIEPEKGLS